MHLWSLSTIYFIHQYVYTYEKQTYFKNQTFEISIMSYQ
jgi:hypothetical protein